MVDCIIDVDDVFRRRFGITMIYYRLDGDTICLLQCGYFLLTNGLNSVKDERISEAIPNEFRKESCRSGRNPGRLCGWNSNPSDGAFSGCIQIELGSPEFYDSFFFSEQLRRSFRPVSEQLQSSYANFEISCLFYIHSLFISPLEFHQLRMVRWDKSSCIHQLFISTGYKQYSVNYE